MPRAISPWTDHSYAMLIDIYIAALLVDEELADQVWEAWDAWEGDIQTALLADAVELVSVNVAGTDSGNGQSFADSIGASSAQKGRLYFLILSYSVGSTSSIVTGVSFSPEKYDSTVARKMPNSIPR